MSETIIDYLKLWRNETPNRTSYLYLDFACKEWQEKKITCREIYENSYKYAQILLNSGVKKGDRIIIIAEERPETIYSIYGSLIIGAIFVLVPTPIDAGRQYRLISTLNSSHAQFVIGENNFKSCIPSSSFLKYFTYTDLKENISVNYNLIGKIEINSDDIACLLYTSGSLSNPKGVMISHNNIIESMKLEQCNFKTTSEDSIITWLPYFHTMQLTGVIFFSTFTNRQTIFMNINNFLSNPYSWIENASKYKATTMIGPISGYLASINNIDESLPLDLSSIKYMICSAEPIEKSNIDLVYAKLKNYNLKKDVFYTGYGLTESTTMIALDKGNIKTISLSQNALLNNKVELVKDNFSQSISVSSVGKFSPNVDYAIVDQTTLKSCAEKVIGELWISHPVNACGYWDLNSETETTFKAHLAGKKNNYLRTGDLGFILDKELYLIGRAKEMMIINGRNLYPKDLECIIKENISTLNNTIIKSFSINKNNTNSLIICIGLKDKAANYEKLINDIIVLVRENFLIDPYDIIFINPNNIPTTDNGKISSNKVRDTYLADSLKSSYSLRVKRNMESGNFNDTELKIKEMFEEILHTSCTAKTNSFYELGGSSLKVIKLIRMINSVFNISLSMDDILNHPTIKEIAIIINKKAKQ